MQRVWYALMLSAMMMIATGCGRDDARTSPSQDMTLPASDADMDAMTPEEEMGDREDLGPEEPQGALVRFDPTDDEDFFALPFPSDARLAANGGEFGFSRWRIPYRKSIVKLWFDAAEELLDGWSPIAGVFVTFDAPIDEATLPSVEESTQTDNGWPSVAMVDIDPDSPTRGELMPLECRFNTFDGNVRVPNQLGCKSPFGIMRRPNTTYALVITDALKDAEGHAVGAPAALRDLLDGEDVEGFGGIIAGAPYAQAAEYVRSLGVEDAIVSMTLVTTGDPAARLRLVSEFYESLPEPDLDRTKPIEVVRTYEEYVVVQAYVDVPIVQNGAFPYNAPPDGKLNVNGEGVVERVDTQSIRVYLTLPTEAMPAKGYPVLMFLHGSGGVAEQLMDRGPVAPNGDPPPPGQGPAKVVAPYGVAGFAADFQFHGMRFDPPDTSGLKLYNLTGNPRATVDNFLVAANEVALHARMLDRITLDPADIEGLAADAIDVSATTDGLIRFDGDSITTMGQSMGSTIGLPAATIDDVTDATILSGSGGVLIEIAVTGTEPIEIATVLKLLLGYDSDEPMDQFDPILHALQHVWDYVDPYTHAPYLVDAPYERIPAKHVLQHSGLTDGYFSPDSRAGLSAALGADLAEPVEEAMALDVMGLVGHGQPVALPVEGNHPSGATAVVAQYPPSVLDGHHVAYQRDDAKAQYACFIKTLTATGTPVLKDPENADVTECVSE